MKIRVFSKWQLFSVMLAILLTLSVSTEARAQVVYLSDDNWSTQNLEFTFNFFGVDYTQIHVGSNGYITFGRGDYSYSPRLSTFVNAPRIGYLNDLYVPGGGYVDVTGTATEMVVSFVDIQKLGRAEQIANYSMTLSNNGSIRLDFGDFYITNGIVGIADGISLSPRITTDFSTATGQYSNSITQYEVFNGGFDLENSSLYFVSDPAPFPVSVSGSIFLTTLPLSVLFFNVAVRIRRKKQGAH